MRKMLLSFTISLTTVFLLLTSPFVSMANVRAKSMATSIFAGLEGPVSPEHVDYQENPELLKVIREYAPEVRLHSEDEYRPSAVEWYLARVQMRFNRKDKLDLQILDKGSVNPDTLISQTAEGQRSDSRQDSDFFLQIPNDRDEDKTRRGEPSGSIPCYVYAKKVQEEYGKDVWDIWYIFFYPYNGPMGAGGVAGAGGAHEGDFEHIKLTFSLADSKIESVYYAAHGGEGKSYTEGSPDPREEYYSLNSENQIIVYSAKDSHASYPFAGEIDRPEEIMGGITTLPNDFTDNGGSVWDCRDNLVLLSREKHPWVQYSGRWGEIGEKSSGPFFFLRDIINPVDVGVILYEHADYGGRKFFIETQDCRNPNLGYYNDEISSVRVIGGAKVVLYWDANYQGKSIMLTEDVPNLGEEWNDKASSYIVGIPAPPGPKSENDLIFVALEDTSRIEFRYKHGDNLTPDGTAEWSGFPYSQIAYGGENDGGGSAIAYINDNDVPDLILMGIDDPSGPNHFYYRIGWDIDDSCSPTNGWSGIRRIVEFQIGHYQSGGGVAVGYINDNWRPDLIFMVIDNPDKDNSYVYFIGWDLNLSGEPEGGWTGLPAGSAAGWEHAGGGAALAYLDGNDRPDLILMGIDNPDRNNRFRYKVGWNLDTNGTPSHWSNTIDGPLLAYENSGGGAEIAYVDDNAIPDLIFMGIDDPGGPDQFWYCVGKDVDSTTGEATWGPIKYTPVITHTADGGGAAMVRPLTKLALKEPAIGIDGKVHVAAGQDVPFELIVQTPLDGVDVVEYRWWQQLSTDTISKASISKTTSPSKTMRFNVPGDYVVYIQSIDNFESIPIKINVKATKGVERVLSIAAIDASPSIATLAQISITDATGIASCDIIIKYDPNVLTIGEVKGTDLFSGMILIANKEAPGVLKLAVAGDKGIPSGSGALVDIGLTVNANIKAGTQTTLEFGDTELYDESGKVISVSLQNGYIKVIDATGIKGDVNGDGEVRSSDAILALRIAAGLMNPNEEQKWAADMNGDGAVKSNDAMLILRKVAGLGAPNKNIIASAGRLTNVIIAETYGVADENITVPINVDNIDRLASGDICIAYDSSVLRAVGVLSAHNLLLEANVDNPGVVRISFASTGKLNSKTLAKIEFIVIADRISPLSLQTAEFYSDDALPLNSRKTDGKFISWAIPPASSALLQNFPNPFNPDTWIPYQLKEASEVKISIYTATGQLVRELALGYKPAGVYASHDRSAYWDGKNEAGEKISSGIYFYNIQASEFTATKKMIVLR